MSLQKQSLSINLAQPMSEQADDKVMPAGMVRKVENFRCDKIGQVGMRPGQSDLSVAFAAGQPVQQRAFAASSARSQLFTHEGQLLAVNRGQLSEWTAQASEWTFRGQASHLLTTERPFPRELWSDEQALGAQTLDACESGQTLSIVSARETANGFELVGSTYDARTDRPLSSAVTSVSVAHSFRCVAFGIVNRVLHTNGSGLYFDGMLVTSDVHATYCPMDAVAGVIGGNTGAFVAWRNAAGNIRTGFVNSAGVLLSTPAAINITATAPTGIAVVANTAITAERYYVAWTNSTGAQVVGVDFTVSSLSTWGAGTVALPTNGAGTVGNSFWSITGAVLTGGDTLWAYDTNEANLSFAFGQDLNQWQQARTVTARLTSTGATSTGLCARGRTARLASKIFSLADTALVMMTNDDDDRASHYVVDLLYGTKWSPTRTNLSSVRSKFAVSRAQPPSRWAPHLPQAIVSAWHSGAVNIPALIRTDFVGQNTISGRIRPMYITAPVMAKVQPLVDAPNLTRIDGNVLVGGGQVQTFDGDKMEAAGFSGFVVDLDAKVYERYVQLSFTDGTVSTQALNTIRFPHAKFLKSVSSGATGTTGTRVQFYDTAGTLYRVYFVIDGVGVAPSGIANNIAVNINSDDVAEVVASKVAAAIDALHSGVFNTSQGSLLTGQAERVTVRPIINGSTTAPAVVFADQPLRTMALGTYQYAACLRWVDRSGKVHRSAPCPTKSYTTVTTGFHTGVASGMIVARVQIAASHECQVEFYRSEQGKSVLYYLGTSQVQGIGDDVECIAVFEDSTQDVDLVRRETIYTSGGVLENWAPGQMFGVTAHKQRVVGIAGTNLESAYYSKTVLPGEPVEFAEENRIAVIAEGGRLTGLASLDEKLILFKRRGIFVVVGDYSSDVGQFGTLSEPQRLPTDIGCVSESSIVVTSMGVMFQSERGIYLLDRSMNLTHIGADVEDSLGLSTVGRALLDEKTNEVMFFLQAPTALVFNLDRQFWSVWTNQRADDACIGLTSRVRIDNVGRVHQHNEGSFVDVLDGAESFFSGLVELPWLSLAGRQDYQRMYRAILLGTYKSDHTIEIDLRYDFDDSPSTALVYSAQGATVIGSPAKQYQVMFRPARQKCQAVKMRLKQTPSGVTPTGECAQWNQLALEIGVKRGLGKVDVGRQRA